MFLFITASFFYILLCWWRSFCLSVFCKCPCFLPGLTLWFAFSDRNAKGLDRGFLILFQMCYFLEQTLLCFVPLKGTSTIKCMQSEIKSGAKKVLQNISWVVVILWFGFWFCFFYKLIRANRYWTNPYTLKILLGSILCFFQNWCVHLIPFFNILSVKLSLWNMQ